MIKLVVAGSKGRMGQLIMKMAAKDRAFNPVLGFDKGDNASIANQGDVVIDFTIPVATLEHVKLCESIKKPIVIGTTGLNSSDMSYIGKASLKIPIVQSPNMSVGVNVFFNLAEQAAKTLKGYSVKVVEAHHQHKKDAPSGTALHVGGLIEKIAGAKVLYESIREGEIVGDHRVIFSGPADRIELFHHADSREMFASGALAAAQWVIGKKPGLYSMQNVLAGHEE